jgi:hypothetical protein
MSGKAEAVRYHEAGHAVVARVLGINVIYVTARPKGKYRGLTCIDYTGRRQEPVEFFNHQIKILLAGSLAEIKRYPDSDWNVLRDNCFDDWGKAYACADRLVRIRRLPRPQRMDIFRQYPATTLIIERTAAETERLLAANWPAVTRVAKALHRNAYLKQPELDALIAGRARRGIQPHCFTADTIANTEIVS